MPYTQDNRLSINTPLGKDVLLLTGFVAREGISQLSSIRAEFLSVNNSIDAKNIVGKVDQPVTITVQNLDGSPRYFSGVVSRFSYLGTGDRLSMYSAEIVPWLWFLTRTSDCRIFMNKSVPQIVEAVFESLGFRDYEIAEIKGSHPKWDYCVQYRETDFNFISRLLEQEGIFYYFRHSDGKSTLVLGDQKNAYKDCAEKEVSYASAVGVGKPIDLLSGWEHSYAFRPGKWAHTDYNFETPATNLLAKTDTVVKMSGVDKYEMFDFPGEYEQKADGESDVKLRMEEDEAGCNVVQGASICRTFGPGGKFTVKDHQGPTERNKGYVITAIQHQVSMGGSYLTGHDETAFTYANSFTCIPDSVTFRPQRVTPKPVVHGVQTAKVVGDAGKEIDVDKYGRIKLQFPWDRDWKNEKDSSCLVRVAQAWAGNQWGAAFWPRIGQEVVVQFLEGDPDRPLVIGGVYNADQMPPYTLPDNKTQSGFKSNSSMDGGGSNELRFEDKKGDEDIYFHAQKDFHREVEHDDDLKVKNDQTINVDQGNRSITVGAGNDSHTIKKGDRAVVIEMGNDSLKIKMGNQTTKLDLGKSEMEAMQSIELKVGQSSVKIDQMGVTIKGMMVKVDGQIQTEIKGMMTQINGDAMLMAKGGITMIG